MTYWQRITITKIDQIPMSKRMIRCQTLLKTSLSGQTNQARWCSHRLGLKPRTLWMSSKKLRAKDRPARKSATLDPWKLITWAVNSTFRKRVWPRNCRWTCRRSRESRIFNRFTRWLIISKLCKRIFSIRRGASEAPSSHSQPTIRCFKINSCVTSATFFHKMHFNLTCQARTSTQTRSTAVATTLKSTSRRTGERTRMRANSTHGKTQVTSSKSSTKTKP